MESEELMQVVVALINNGYFPKYSVKEAESLAIDIATFWKTYYNEMKK